MMSRVSTNAIWSLRLLATCPHCDGDLDLLDNPEFLDANVIEYGEVDTPATVDVLVFCDSCHIPFNVTFES